MAQQDVISVHIPESELSEIKAAIATLQAKLLPHLKTLTSHGTAGATQDGRQDGGVRDEGP